MDNCHPCRQSHLEHNEETSGELAKREQRENLAHFPCALISLYLTSLQDAYTGISRFTLLMWGHKLKTEEAKTA